MSQRNKAEVRKHEKEKVEMMLGGVLMEDELGVQSSPPIESSIMAPGSAAGRRKFRRCGKKWRGVVWEKKVFWRLQSLENQDAEVDVVKNPEGGQGHRETKPWAERSLSIKPLRTV